MPGAFVHVVVGLSTPPTGKPLVPHWAEEKRGDKRKTKNGRIKKENLEVENKVFLILWI